MKYTAEEVRETERILRKHSNGPGTFDYEASDMLNAYADSLERAQGGVTDGVVDVVHDTIFGHPSFDIGENGFLGKPAVRAALLAVWPNPPAQAAQGEASLGRCKACGRATRAVCDGLDGNGLGCTNAPSIDLAAVREAIAHLRSFRSNTPPTWAHLEDAADKLEAAIKVVVP